MSSRPFLRKFGTCCVRKTSCLIQETFSIVFPVLFWSFKVGVDCWAGLPDMRRGCSVCSILPLVGQNLQIPKQPIGMAQLCC